MAAGDTEWVNLIFCILRGDREKKREICANLNLFPSFKKKEGNKFKLANMLKRKKLEKEMGGEEKLRAKKKKRLLQDAAKCSRLTELFRGGGAKVSAATVSEETGPSSRHNAGMSGCSGSGCNFRPLENSSL